MVATLSLSICRVLRGHKEHDRGTYIYFLGRVTRVNNDWRFAYALAFWRITGWFMWLIVYPYCREWQENTFQSSRHPFKLQVGHLRHATDCRNTNILVRNSHPVHESPTPNSSCMVARSIPLAWARVPNIILATSRTSLRRCRLFIL